LSPFYLWTGCNLVSVAVNKEPPMTARAVDGGPLYLVAPWDSSKYRKSAPTFSTLPSWGYFVVLQAAC
jgi:hypothetical protein